MTRRALTLVLPHYRNLGMLAEQQRMWAGYPPELREHLHVIIVDDGSPKAFRPSRKMMPTAGGLASLRLYRILVDVRWNWLACRNLGVSEAWTDWVLLTDIDHVLPSCTLRVLLEQKLQPQAVYRFSRVDAPDLSPYKPHPNSWLLTRDMFDAIGGYDERFSGYYGSDSEFRERVHATAQAVVMLPTPLVRYPREVIADASTTNYGRKEEQDGKNVARIREERARIQEWRPLRLTFPWERVF